jgi:putative RNA 2'-phosphotransferase
MVSRSTSRSASAQSARAYSSNRDFPPMRRSDVFISKKMSYCLRHNPYKYGLHLDERGFVDLHDFLAAMNRVHRFDPPLTEQRIREIMAHSDKQRFAIENGKIGALYGHSLPGHVIRPQAVPPDTLYHGTAHRFVSSIMDEGLLPEGRQYVHLSADIPLARQVGLRRDAHPVIFAIDAQRAHHDGIRFFEGGRRVWLCEKMPARYLTIIPDHA